MEKGKLKMNTLPTSVSIEPVDYAEINEDANSSLAVSLELKIDTPAMYELAGEELISVKQKIKALETRREAITKPLTAAHKAVMDLFREPITLLTQAKDCLQQGMIEFTEQTKQLVSSGTEVVPVVASEGNAIRKTWKGRCTDKMAFIKFVAANPAYIHALDINQKVLNDLAKSHQDSFDIPGCEAYQESSIVSRTK